MCSAFKIIFHLPLQTKKTTYTSVRCFSLSCGGRTRTCDLQVMSLASYQLLHSAMYFCFAGAKVGVFFELTK